MDDLAQYNQARWEDLAAANVTFSRPWLDLTPATARALVDPAGLLGDVAGKDVLCLASGGGQQSVAFALLGANVTVTDLSPTQLQRDQDAAAHYNLTIRTLQTDMRDLSALESSSFDVVWHAYSINFIPEIQTVLGEVSRVLRDPGMYRIEWANPFVAGISEEEWTGAGYPLKQPYVNGAELVFPDDSWTFEDHTGAQQRVVGPREFRHTLSAVLNGLVQHGFIVLGLWEELSAEPDAAPGTWEHLKSIAPPWLTLWAAYRPATIKELMPGRP
ncbi:MAG TPA: class I SAM-dependent methyltransferase [Herpetosiphonaceae bacterium]